MKTTMDQAGRIVIPAAIRARLGMVPGPVDVVIDGAHLRIEIATADNVTDKDGRLVIRSTGTPLSADDVRELRLADQR